VLAVFQPHLFSRTRDFLDGFAASLGQFHKVALLDIYPAREVPITGITSTLLAQKIKENTPQATVVEVLEKTEIASFIEKMKTRIVVMIGAGDIGSEIDRLTKNWAHEKI
jgi:UDP-N-acetylmuramate--alanine ligase